MDPSLSLNSKYKLAPIFNRNWQHAFLVVLMLFVRNGSAQQISATQLSLERSGLQFGIVDWSLAGAVLADRVSDWTTTEECLRRPWNQCHEGELPSALVRNKAGFAAFEGAASALSLVVQNKLTKHGHRRLARLGGSMHIGILTRTVVDNYALDDKLYIAGLRPVHRHYGQ